MNNNMSRKRKRNDIETRANEKTKQQTNNLRIARDSKAEKEYDTLSDEDIQNWINENTNNTKTIFKSCHTIDTSDCFFGGIFKDIESIKGQRGKTVTIVPRCTPTPYVNGKTCTANASYITRIINILRKLFEEEKTYLIAHESFELPLLKTALVDLCHISNLNFSELFDKLSIKMMNNRLSVAFILLILYIINYENPPIDIDKFNDFNNEFQKHYSDIKRVSDAINSLHTKPDNSYEAFMVGFNEHKSIFKKILPEIKRFLINNNATVYDATQNANQASLKKLVSKAIVGVFTSSKELFSKHWKKAAAIGGIGIASLATYAMLSSSSHYIPMSNIFSNVNRLLSSPVPVTALLTKQSPHIVNTAAALKAVGAGVATVSAGLAYNKITQSPLKKSSNSTPIRQHINASTQDLDQPQTYIQTPKPNPSRESFPRALTQQSQSLNYTSMSRYASSPARKNKLITYTTTRDAPMPLPIQQLSKNPYKIVNGNKYKIDFLESGELDNCRKNLTTKFKCEFHISLTVVDEYDKSIKHDKEVKIVLHVDKNENKINDTWKWYLIQVNTLINSMFNPISGSNSDARVLYDDDYKVVETYIALPDQIRIS
jgi:hypothetical protein